MSAGRILLVEDEESLIDVIRLNLELEGFQVVVAKDGRMAIKTALESRFDLIILDVMLPEINGFDICESIRLENKNVPIFFLTAKNTSQDRVAGLKLGADDYLTKPFNLEELLLRVQLLVKRGFERQSSIPQADSFSFSGNVVNFSDYSIKTYKGEELRLTKKEIQLLKLLIDRKNEVVSRKQILEKVWGYDIYPSTRTIDNFILNFRKYFEPDSKEPRHFESVRGVGYMFKS
jgi:two-component system alkaline phosphatase synthesis response regulator PhoP